MAIYAIENGDGECIAVGYESSHDARQDAKDSTNGGRARSFETVADLREFYADAWLDRYTDDELRENP